MLCTNRSFNELLGFPPAFDWPRSSLRLIDDRQFAAAGLESHFERALRGAATELHSVPYEPSANPFGLDAQPGTLKLSIVLRPLTGEEGAVACVVCFISDYAAAGSTTRGR